MIKLHNSLALLIFSRMVLFFTTFGHGQRRALTEKSRKIFEIGLIKQFGYSSLTDLNIYAIRNYNEHHSVVSSQKNKCIICHDPHSHLIFRRDYPIFMSYLQPVKSDPCANKILHQDLSRFPLNKGVNIDGYIQVGLVLLIVVSTF